MADGPQIAPYLSYEDGNAAIDFLETAFGFSTVIRQPDEDGALLHAELRYGAGIVLVGTEARGKGSPGIYVVVEDVEAHHARAMAAGAELVYGPETTEWGTMRYRVRDPEGHEWTFGTYQPSLEPPAWG